MKTFGQLKETERRILWPSPGEPRNQREAHDRFFVEAMLELQKWVPCLQLNNTSVFAHCTTLTQCGKTVVPAPFGRIKRVYTVASEGWCDPVHYSSRNFDDLEAFARNVNLNWVAPSQEGLPELPQGFLHPDTSNDNKCGRARVGIWAINRRRLYLAPWIESNESVVVEWDGVNQEWKDEDVLDEEVWTPDTIGAVRLYVKWKNELEFGCDAQRRRDLEQEWKAARADRMYWCQKYTEEQETYQTDMPERLPTAAEVKAGKAGEVETVELFAANIGDFGTDDANELAVAELVKSKSPEFILTNGDNTYLEDPNLAYEQGVAKYYSQYIYPYSGAYEKSAAENLFWPVPGNHDRDVDDDGDLASYLRFFTLPGKMTYYELVRGPVHFFMLDSTVEAEDGNTADSEQAIWLKAKMLTSPARWKICIIHDAPYTSAAPDDPGILRSRWPFKEWGADLVISGDEHSYERLKVDGLDYIVNGAGGRTLIPFADTPIAGSLVRYSGFGAGFLRVTCSELVYEFYSVDGVLRDTLTLEKE